MFDLRNPSLRARDLRRIIDMKISTVIWDPGIEKNNEWIYASIENERCRLRLNDWMNQKNINPDYDCIYLNSSWSVVKQVKWCDLVNTPENFFSGQSFEVISFDVTWLLGYWDMNIARFGRFISKHSPN